MNKFVSILIVLLLGPLFFLNLLSISYKQSVNGEFFKKELVKYNTYQLVFDKLPEIMSFVEEGEGGAAISSQQTEATIRQYLTPADLKFAVEQIIDNGGNPVGVQDQINQRLNQKLKASFEPVFASLPVCSSPEEQVCKPEGADFNATLAHLAKSGDLTGTPLDALVSAGTKTEEKNVKLPAKNFGFLSNLSILKYASWITLSFILLLVLIMARLFADSWKKTALPLGVYLLIYALLSFISGLVIFKLAVPNLASFLPIQKGDLVNTVITPFVRDLSVVLSREFNKNILILAAFGFVLTIVGIIVAVTLKPTAVPAQAAKIEPVKDKDQK